VEAPARADGELESVRRNIAAAGDLAKLYALAAPNYAAVIESYQKAQEAARQRASTQVLQRGRAGSRSQIWRQIMSSINGLKTESIRAIVIAAPLVVVASLAIAAQDWSTLKIPDGLSFSDFTGYENWQDVAVSQTKTSIKVIVANPVMMEAFRSGLPASGKVFPDGSKVAKIEWGFKKNTVAPYFVNVPDKLKTLAFIEKDTKRFPNTHGWAYAQWEYDPATDTLKTSKLSPSGAECGFQCHSKVSAQDYIYTAYPKR
jgi:hypothetical protein